MTLLRMKIARTITFLMILLTVNVYAQEIDKQKGTVKIITLDNGNFSATIPDNETWIIQNVITSVPIYNYKNFVICLKSINEFSLTNFNQTDAKKKKIVITEIGSVVYSNDNLLKTQLPLVFPSKTNFSLVPLIVSVSESMTTKEGIYTNTSKSTTTTYRIFENFDAPIFLTVFVMKNDE